MPSRIDWYLVELDRQLADFSEERREILLTEVESHLRDQTDEMVAAGMSAGEADREAVRIFGEPAQFAERLREETPVVRENEASLKGTANGVVGLSLGLVLFVAGMAVLGEDRSGLLFAWILICVAVVMGSAISSRRVTLAGMLAGIGFGGVAAAVTLGLAFVDFGDLDGYDISSVAVAREAAEHPPQSYFGVSAPASARQSAAYEALAVPAYQRMLCFQRDGFLASITGTGAMFVVWLWRHGVRLSRLMRQAVRRKTSSRWTGVR